MEKALESLNHVSRFKVDTHLHVRIATTMFDGSSAAFADLIERPSNHNCFSVYAFCNVVSSLIGVEDPYKTDELAVELQIQHLSSP